MNATLLTYVFIVLYLLSGKVVLDLIKAGV